MPRPLSAVTCGLIPLIASMFAFSGWAADAGLPPGLALTLRHATVRIQYEREAHGATITGHGTAFGVDLSAYGYSGRRYLLTAAHNVLDDSKRPYSTLKVEIEGGPRAGWSRARALAWDRDLDLCLIEADDCLPELLVLADREPGLGSRLVLAGSPRGIPVALFSGDLAGKFDRGTIRCTARIPFDHGDSGGPLVEAGSGRVIGVAVAGVPKDGDLDRELGLFVPVVGVTSFLEANRRGAPLEVAQATGTPVPVTPAAPPVALTPAPAHYMACNAASPRPPQSVAVETPPAGAPPAVLNRTMPASSAGGTPAARLVAREPKSQEPRASSPVGSSSAGATPAGPAATPVAVAREAANSAGGTLAAPAATPVAATREAANSAGGTPAAPAATPVAVAREVASPSGAYYVVQKGDNLTRIARLHNVSLQALIAANTLRNPNLLPVGAKLTIPQAQQ